MKKIIFYLFILCIFSCDTKNELPGDFNFKIDFGSQSYDSKSEILTRKFRNSKDKHIIIKFSEKQRIAIYQYCNKIAFLKFPIEFECDSLYKKYNENFTDIEIEIIANEIVKASRTKTWCVYKTDPKKEKQLLNLSQYILKILIENKEYKKLPPTDYFRL